MRLIPTNHKKIYPFRMKPVMKRSRGSQTDGFNMDKPKKMTVDTSTQISSSTGSYKRNRIINDLDKEGMTIRKLYTEVICNKETAIRWTMDNGLIASSMKCSFCSSDMDLKDAQNYSSDGCRWRCRKKDHSSEASIRKGSWFEKSNLTLEEIIELTYWWSTGKYFPQKNNLNLFRMLIDDYIVR